MTSWITTKMIQTDKEPLYGLFPWASGIDVAVCRYRGEQQLYIGVSKSAGADAIEAFDRDVKVRKRLAEHGLIPAPQVGDKSDPSAV